MAKPKSSSKKTQNLKPGEIPIKPGEYLERGPRGGEVNDPRQVTMERGDKPMPPTQQKKRTWERTGPPEK